MATQAEGSREAESRQTCQMSESDTNYVRWARDLGMDIEIRTPKMEAENDDDLAPEVKWQVTGWLDETYVGVIDRLWKDFVPERGESVFVQGELVRCIGRLEGDYARNGMANMGDGYYDAMVRFICDHFSADTSITPFVKDVLKADAQTVLEANYEDIVSAPFFEETDIESALYRIKILIAYWCTKHQEPIPRA
jgi:hypothetical protein